jgi:hypothetical protein
VFALKPSLVNQHPRLFFTRTEADSLYTLFTTKMNADFQSNLTTARGLAYPAVGTEYELRGQQFWWRLTRLALTASINQDAALIDSCVQWLVNLNAENWKLDSQTTVSLGGAHLIAAYALAYDCMHPYLSTPWKDTCQARLRYAITMLQTQGFNVPDYWTRDYQNNHMHFRLTAYAFCILAIADEPFASTAQNNQLVTLFRRMNYVLAHDGTSHEGLEYQQYGHQLLETAIMALKHCTSQDLTTAEHFRNTGYSYLYHTTPGWRSGFGFGDGGNGIGGYPHFMYPIINTSRDQYLNYFINRLRENNASAFWQLHWMLLFRDPDLAEKNVTDLPLHRYFDDVGLLVCRSDWSDHATAMAFKCGPLGGKKLWEVRGTEYHPLWQQGDWFAVAHDDPDAGTFLLFTKGQFITTGDGYEKTAKITTQHSTFIVDDATQNGGGGGWCQPPDAPGLTAWPLDYFATNERAVFRGDLHGTYASMTRLTRTFVSQQARYFVIYDDALSAATNRTFEWRLQTNGTLADLGNKTYQITSGAATTLAKIYYPTTAVWSDTTNKIGNILRARLTGLTENRFMVLLWPNATNLNAVRENYNSDSTLGLRVAQGGNFEYTLFAKGNQGIAAGPVKANAAAVVASTDSHSIINLQQASVINGTSFDFSGLSYFRSTTPINYSFDSTSFAANGYGLWFRVAPAAGTDTSTVAQIIINNANVYYNVFVGDSMVTGGMAHNFAITLSLKINKEYRIRSFPDIGVNDKLVGTINISGVRLHPLPVTDNLTCDVTLRQSGRALVAVRDCRGNLVKAVYNGLVPAGPHQFTWDCTNQSGRHVEPGMYVLAVNGQAHQVMVAR